MIQSTSSDVYDEEEIQERLKRSEVKYKCSECGETFIYYDVIARERYKVHVGHRFELGTKYGGPEVLDTKELIETWENDETWEFYCGGCNKLIAEGEKDLLDLLEKQGSIPCMTEATKNWLAGLDLWGNTDKE